MHISVWGLGLCGRLICALKLIRATHCNYASARMNMRDILALCQTSTALSTVICELPFILF